ncbi:uncharacterized protein LOC135465132 [Liolophura sinensis]|uniref:uncharacterized protein LOC135465132 n=1 Tax=Liolophura sinensis TaxID=3198878 RepID=UPI0031598081
MPGPPALPSITSPLIDSPVRLAGVIIGSLIGLMLVVFIVVIVILRRRKQNERLNKAEAEPRDRNIARSSNVQNQSYAEVRMSDLVGTELDDNMASVTQYSEDSQALYSNDLVKERKMKQRQMEQQERAFHNDAAVYENEPGLVGGVPTNGASAMTYDTLWKSGVTTSSDDTYNHLHQQTVVPEKKVETHHSVNVYNHLYGKGKALPKPVHGPTSVQDNLYSLANNCNDSN